MRRIGTALLAAILPAVAVAQAEEPDAHRHLGFYLRVDGAAGYLGTSASLGGESTSAKGLAIPAGVSVGGAIAENLILAGEFWGAWSPSPTVKVGRQAASAGDSGLGMAGFGLQFTYYLMPANVYLSLTPTVTWTSLASNGADADTRPGFGLKVGVGKEWWVGAHWGLGLAAQLVLGVNEDKGNPPSSWTTLGGGVALSATYN